MITYVANLANNLTSAGTVNHAVVWTRYTRLCRKRYVSELPTMKRYTEKSSSPESSELNHSYYKEGCDHFRQGNFKRASKAFSAALEYWPEDGQAWLALGNCYDELNKPKRAEECYRNSLKYSEAKDASGAHYNLGNSLYDQERFDEAIEHYSIVSGQSEVYWPAQRNMARAKNEL